MKPEYRKRLLYVVVDYIAANVGWGLFNAIRYFILSLERQGYESVSAYLQSFSVMAGQIFGPLAMMVVFYLSGYYNRVFMKSRAGVVLTTLGSIFIVSLIAFFTMLVNDLTSDRIVDYNLVGVLFFVLFFSIFIPRWILTRLTTASIVSGEISFPTLVVGTSDDAEAMSRRIAVLQGSRGFRIVGYVNAGSHHISPVGVMSYTMDDIVDVCAENNVENIILIPEESDSDADSRNHLLEMVNRLFPLECAIYISPSTAHFLTSRVRQTDITSEPLIDISRSDMSDSTVNMKRVSDVAVSVVVLLLISPLLAILGLMVKMDSPGPAFYRQQRVGRHKKVFYINKLRTMRIDAESSGPSLSSENDPRVTRLGRVLRKYRLDELPQFWNVLKGDMSLVGPRPEREYFLSRIVAKAPYYVLLLQVRPGITSWGMVKYGYAENVDEMIERSRYDLLYLENISFTVDMKILFHTVHTVLTGKGV